MWHILLFVLLFVCQNQNADVFYSLSNRKTGQQEALIADLRIKDCEQIVTQYQSAILDFPRFLDYCNTSCVPCIVIVPEHLNVVGPLDSKAPGIEAPRTALAWIRAYYEEFGGIVYPLILACDVPVALDALGLPFLLNYHDLICRSFDPSMIKSSQYHLPEYFDAGKDSEYYYTPFAFAHTLQINLIPDPWPSSQEKKRCLISGGAGFIGSYLVHRLLRDGYCVIVLDNLSSGSLENLKDVIHDPDLYFAQCDVCLPLAVDGPLDLIIHAASLPSPAYYYKMPYETMAVGLQGTQNLLDLAREKNARFLFTSTSEIYGDPLVHPQPESYEGNVDYVGKRSGYDQSKRGAETLIKLYFECYGLDVRIARIFNTYGPHMQLNDGRVIPNFINAILNHEPMILYGDGMQTRSFAFVDDTVDGLLALLQNETITGMPKIQDRVFNIGNPDEFTICDLAQKLTTLSKKIVGYQVPVISIANPDSSDPRMRRPDIARAASILGFTPKITLDYGLEQTLFFFLESFNEAAT